MKRIKKILAIVGITSILATSVSVNAVGVRTSISRSSSVRTRTSTPKVRTSATRVKTSAKPIRSTPKVKSATKSKVKSTTVKPKVKTVNNTKMKSVPSAYREKSVSQKYYYSTPGSGNSFWSNYWMYRALTPNNRSYVTNGNSIVAPAYTGFHSIFAELITLICIVIAIVVAIYIVRKRKTLK